MALETQVTTRERNQRLLSYIETPGFEKKATDALNNFTRTKMREEGFWRKLMPPIHVPNDELDRAVDTDKPVKIIDREPDSPAAVTLPFADFPSAMYIKAPRYRVLFNRIITPRFTKDVDELRTYQMDVRQVFSDNSIKDMLAEEDSKFIGAVNTALGTKDSTQALAGTVLYKGFSGGIVRESVVETFKMINRASGRLESHTCLTNFTTWKEFMKWPRNEMGGDLSQDVVKNGMKEAHFLDRDWVVTIKRDLIPDDHIYHFADPSFIGKSMSLEDTTLFVKKEAFMVEWFSYETIGGAIGWVSGMSHASFD